ncbi:sigma-70 family RNA polymerase sigma factor [Planctomicrobium sp. SH664]|uniref:sigma-70 family RNA polymerase sigma factor n=1 Tax=Planctomicrobium sp. SH664 TaxID=3448125 RepID=UPI003F5BB441
MGNRKKRKKIDRSTGAAANLTNKASSFLSFRDKTVRHQHEEFVKAFTAIHRQLYAYVVALTPQLHDADDVFQRTSLALWERWTEFDPQRDFLAWAAGVARIQAKNYLTRGGRLGEALDESTACQIADVLQKSGAVIDRRLDLLHGCLQRLTEPQRALLKRCYAENAGFELRSIAEEMQITANSLYQRLKRLREMLHECIDRGLVAERGA